MSRDPNAIAPQISEAAAEWFLTMREPKVSEEDRVAFTDWLQASPVHVRAYLDIARLWGDAAQLDPELPIEVDPALASANVLPLREGHTAPRFKGAAVDDAPSAAEGAHRWKRVRRPFVIAASILIVAGLAGGGTWWQTQQPPTYATDVGEQRVITLEDGSIIRLNSRSQVRVRLTPEQRDIELIDGQALFEVAKDPERPFIVRSGTVTARAVGTQFDVYRKRMGTVVTVVEGQVEVRTDDPAVPETGRAPGSPVATPVAVKAGEQVTVSRAGVIEQRRDANVNAATRWLQQQLVFEDQPLSAVIEEFNRYQRVPIVLADPSLGNLRINAVFNTTGPEPLLRFVSRLDGVQVERTRREIRISRQQ